MITIPLGENIARKFFGSCPDPIDYPEAHRSFMAQWSSIASESGRKYRILSFGSQKPDESFWRAMMLEKWFCAWTQADAQGNHYSLYSYCPEVNI